MATFAAQGGIGEYFASQRRGMVVRFTDFAKARPLGALCLGLLVAVLLIAAFANFVAPFSPTENHTVDRLHSPSSTYWLGTDNFGRDVLSRILYGARISLEVAALSVTVSLALSLTIGITAAYLRGPWDFVVGRFIDVAQALPGLVLLIALLAVFGRSVASIGVVLGVASGITGSRIVRGAAFGVTAQPFVEVARTVGCSPLRIMWRHVSPNVFPIAMVLGTINVGTAIVAEASLSFIGYGVQPPTPSWGGMLSADGRPFMVVAPWLFWAPTIALALVVFSINMLGDALRDRMDPRLRGGK